MYEGEWPKVEVRVSLVLVALMLPCIAKKVEERISLVLMAHRFPTMASGASMGIIVVDSSCVE